MKPIDFRNATFESLRALLAKKREAVWLDWIAYETAHVAAGATTREVCEWFKRDILAFRPRCTELYQIGVLMLVGQDSVAPKSDQGSTESRPTGREGRYRVRSFTEWQAWHAEQQHAALSGQLQMAI